MRSNQKKTTKQNQKRIPNRKNIRNVDRNVLFHYALFLLRWLGITSKVKTTCWKCGTHCLDSTRNDTTDCFDHASYNLYDYLSLNNCLSHQNSSRFCWPYLYLRLLSGLKQCFNVLRIVSRHLFMVSLLFYANLKINELSYGNECLWNTWWKLEEIRGL